MPGYYMPGYYMLGYNMLAPTCAEILKVFIDGFCYVVCG